MISIVACCHSVKLCALATQAFRFRSRGMTQYQKKVTLSGKRCPACGVTAMCYGCYANGYRFGSHLADLRFAFFFAFFQAQVLRIEVSVVRLGGLG